MNKYLNICWMGGFVGHFNTVVIACVTHGESAKNIIMKTMEK